MSDWIDRVGDGLREHEDERTGRLPEIGRYSIEAVLGEGAMAVVYRARDRELGRTVAIKILRQGVALNEAARKRFHREAQAAAKLAHPNVVAVYDAGEENGLMYLVMELVAGRPLSDVLRERRPLRALVEIVEKTARGVHHAHEHGIIHRDLKPSNILVTEGDEPKVGDFGLAHVASAGTLLTQSGALLGTPLYMAPEQAEGRTRDVTRRTDVYALGAILYEAATGRAPVEGDSIAQVYARIATQEPRPPRELNANVPADLQAVILKAIEKEPLGRYPTALALADDLRRWMAGEAIVARRDSTLQRWRRRLARGRWGVAAAVALAFVAGVVAVQFTRPSPPPPRAPAPTPEIVLTASPSELRDHDLGVYCDQRYPFAFIHKPARLRDYFEHRGFRVLNADDLGAWMEAHVEGARRGFLVMAQDILPETVIATPGPSCLARRYLNAGNWMLWPGDIPFVYIGRTTGRQSYINLTFDTLGLHDAMWEGRDEVVVTDAGVRWGVTEAGVCRRAVPLDEVTVPLVRCGAHAETSWWIKCFSRDGRGGLIRYWDDDVDSDADHDRCAAAGWRLAQRALGRAPTLTLATPATVDASTRGFVLRMEGALAADAHASLDGGATWIAIGRDARDGAMLALPVRAPHERVRLRLDVRQGHEPIGSVFATVRVAGPSRVRIESPAEDENLRGPVTVRVAVEGGRRASLRAIGAHGRIVPLPESGEFDADSLAEFGPYGIVAELATEHGVATDAVRVRHEAVPHVQSGSLLTWTFTDHAFHATRDAEWDVLVRDADRVFREMHDVFGAGEAKAARVLVMHRELLYTWNPAAEVQVPFGPGRAPAEAWPPLALQLGRLVQRRVTQPRWPGNFGDALAVVMAQEAVRRLGVPADVRRDKKEATDAFALEVWEHCGWDAIDRALTLLERKMPLYGALGEPHRWWALLAALRIASRGAADEAIRRHSGKAGFTLVEDQVKKYAATLGK